MKITMCAFSVFCFLILTLYVADSMLERRITINEIRCHIGAINHDSAVLKNYMLGRGCCK